MSTGISGPIDAGGVGDLSTHYAIAATYRANMGWSNKLAVTCKRCGKALPKGEGTRVTMTAVNGPYPSQVYLCHSCVAWVQESLQIVMDRQAKDAADRLPAKEKK